MNISFFAKPPYMLRHMQRVSSILRGEQMAAYMQNARLNPESGYENDICIYVKPNIKPGQDFKFEGIPYLDLVDGFELVNVLRQHPKVTGIVFSDMDVETVTKMVSNKIVCIPHQHINFERQTRPIRKMWRIGIIGSELAVEYLPEEIKKGIADRGLELVHQSIMFPRSSVTHFYRRMDAMIVWRPYNLPYQPGLYNPFKIVNASAFGLPTIALDEPAFHEMEDCYIPVSNVKNFFKALDTLRNDQVLYENMYNTCLAKAERYHISNIAKLYQALT